TGGRVVEWTTQMGELISGTDVPERMTLFSPDGWVTDAVYDGASPRPLSAFPLDTSVADVARFARRDLKLIGYNVQTAWGDAYTTHSALNDLFGRAVVTVHPAQADLHSTLDLALAWTPGTNQPTLSFRIVDGKWTQRHRDITDRAVNGYTRAGGRWVPSDRAREQRWPTPDQVGPYRVIRTEDNLGEVWDSYYVPGAPVGLVRKTTQGPVTTTSFYTPDDWTRLGFDQRYGSNPFEGAESRRPANAFAVPLGRFTEIQKDGQPAQQLAVYVLEQTGAVIPEYPGVPAYRYRVDNRLKSQKALRAEERLPSGLTEEQDFEGAGANEPRLKRLFFDAAGYPTFTTGDGVLYERLKVIPDAAHPGFVWIYSEPVHPEGVAASVNGAPGQLSLFYNGYEIRRWSYGRWGSTNPNDGIINYLLNTPLTEYFFPNIQDRSWIIPQGPPTSPAPTQPTPPRSGRRRTSMNNLGKFGRAAAVALVLLGAGNAARAQAPANPGAQARPGVSAPARAPQANAGRVLGSDRQDDQPSDTPPSLQDSDSPLPTRAVEPPSGDDFENRASRMLDGRDRSLEQAPYRGDVPRWVDQRRPTHPSEKPVRIGRISLPTWLAVPTLYAMLIGVVHFFTYFVFPGYRWTRGRQKRLAAQLTNGDGTGPEPVYRSPAAGLPTIDRLEAELAAGGIDGFLAELTRILTASNAPQRTFMPRAIARLRDLELLDAAAVRAVLESVRRRQEDGSSFAAVAMNEIYTGAVERAIAPHLEASFDAIRFGTNNSYEAAQRARIRAKFVSHTAVLLGHNAEYLSRSEDGRILIHPPYEGVRDRLKAEGWKLLSAGRQEMEKTLVGAVWSDVFRLPTSVTGFV
ncbi:MAG: hypothetical protein JO102_01150, partial [Elusimicrobia bacterium]|nr:hypothetical protein [Elusimicrobiota bacterium]